MASSRWIVIELSEQGELATSREINNYLSELFGEDSQFFVPIHQEKMGSYTSTSVLLEGYVFVKDSQYVRDHLSELRDYRVFSRVLENCGRIQTVDSSVVGALKRRLKRSVRKNPELGSKVKIVNGIFSNLPGEVVGVEDRGRKIMVKICTLSREILAPLPSTSVEEIRDEMPVNPPEILEVYSQYAEIDQ